jgi:hypothetical protein
LKKDEDSSRSGGAMGTRRRKRVPNRTGLPAAFDSRCDNGAADGGEEWEAARTRNRQARRIRQAWKSCFLSLGRILACHSDTSASRSPTVQSSPHPRELTKNAANRSATSGVPADRRRVGRRPVPQDLRRDSIAGWIFLSTERYRIGSARTPSVGSRIQNQTPLASWYGTMEIPPFARQRTCCVFTREGAAGAALA